MRITDKLRKADAAADRALKASSFGTGLSAWLGGVAFSVGVGQWAPMWVAAVLTVLSAGIFAASSALARSGRAADILALADGGQTQ